MMIVFRCGVAALLLVLGSLARPADAQDASAWPRRPVRIVVGFAPSSTPDVLARIIADNLQKQTGHPFIVENKIGAGGNVAADAVAKAAPDGHTLGVTSAGPLIVNPMTMDTPYNPKADLRPITLVATQPSVLVVSTALGVTSLADLIARLKKNPGQYNYASIGIGSISHLAMELVALKSGTEVVHIPYAGSAEAVRAIVMGEAQMGALPPLSVIPSAETGQLRMVAVTTPKRWFAIPDVPTFKEAGLPGVEAEAWMGLIAPAKTPSAIVERLYTEVKATLGKPEVQEQLHRVSFEPVGNTPEEFAAVLRDEEVRWSVVIDKIGLRRK